MRKIKTWFCCFLTAIFALCVSGCSYKYKGDRPDWYTVACTNLLHANGSFYINPEVIVDPRMYELEKDDYGRVLFSYQEGNTTANLLIMQKSENGRVYYYPEDCYLSLRLVDDDALSPTHSVTLPILRKMLQNVLSEEDLTAFKTLNDWNTPLQEEKCTSTPISNLGPNTETAKNNSPYQKAALAYFEKEGRYVQPHPYNSNPCYLVTYVQWDAYGRELVTFEAEITDFYENREVETRYSFVGIFDPDGSYNLDTVVLLGDFTTYSATVKQIKVIGNWNKPL
ncbi:MAG: hypothetical protein J6D30_02250 [Clostridia bacterium]|nr:hypothetical protein [Clostridia bacterium]